MDYYYFFNQLYSSVIVVYISVRYYYLPTLLEM